MYTYNNTASTKWCPRKLLMCCLEGSADCIHHSLSGQKKSKSIFTVEEQHESQSPIFENLRQNNC